MFYSWSTHCSSKCWDFIREREVGSGFSLPRDHRRSHSPQSPVSSFFIFFFSSLLPVIYHDLTENGLWQAIKAAQYSTTAILTIRCVKLFVFCVVVELSYVLLYSSLLLLIWVTSSLYCALLACLRWNLCKNVLKNTQFIIFSKIIEILELLFASIAPRLHS